MLHSLVATDNLNQALSGHDQATQTDSYEPKMCMKLVDQVLNNSDFRRQLLLYLLIIVTLARYNEEKINFDKCPYGKLAHKYTQTILKHYDALDVDEV
jgi:hypothetical protein